MSEFESYLKIQKNYSSHTVTAYVSDINQFFHFNGVLSHSSVKLLLSNKGLRRWIRHLSECKIKPKSIHRKISSLNTFANFLFTQGYVQEAMELNVQLPKLRKPIPSYVKINEINDLLNALEKQAKSYDEWLEFMIMSTFYNTGIRRSELINLENKNYNSAKSELKVFGKGSKERIIPINNEFASQLDEFIE